MPGKKNLLIVSLISSMLLVTQRSTASVDTLVIGIFRDKHFEGREVPASLKPETFADTWGKLPGVKILYLDIDQIRAYSNIFREQMDILVFPYGGFYPMEAFGYYSGQSFNYFLRKGGAILSTGDIPFSKQTNKNLSTPGRSDSMNVDPDLYDKWLSKFGIKYYISATNPSQCVANPDFLQSASGSIKLAPDRTGIISNNSSHEPVPKPSNGNVFPERFPARQVIPLLWSTDRFGKRLATNALLVQDFQNGSRQILIANNTEPHLLSPSPQLQGIMMDLFRLITNKVIARDIESSYACYKKGEGVSLKGEIISFENQPTEIETRLDILDSAKKAVYSKTEIFTVSGKKPVIRIWSWKPANFQSDEYVCRLRIYRNGKLVSETENGFVIWNDEIIRRGPGIKVKNEYFDLAQGQSFITGTNYYESTRGEIMWYRPNVKNIITDIQEMHASGINYVRPHYHHLKWFKDYLLYHHNKLFEFYDSLQNLENPLPDEKGWRIWDMFIYLTQKYGIIYGGDLFTLVPEDMGDPRGWWGTTETIYSKSGRAIQKEFLKQLDTRYAAVKGISWDLFNEPFDIPKKDIEDWASDLKRTLNATNTRRLISIGGSHNIDHDIIDYETPHGIPPANEYNNSGIPMVMQELHIDRKEGFKDEKDQADALREQFVVVVRNGYSGICPWSWSRQMRLWQDSYEHHHSFPMEKWDDRLGLHTHDDGTTKMAGQVFKDLSFLIKRIPFKDFDPVSRKVHTAKGEVIAGISNGQSYIYHVSNGQCYAAMAKDSLSWSGGLLMKGPTGSYNYLFSADGKTIEASKQLFLKTDKPGNIILAVKNKPAGIFLVEPAGENIRIMKNLEGSLSNSRLSIHVPEEFTNYWIKVMW